METSVMMERILAMRIEPPRTKSILVCDAALGFNSSRVVIKLLVCVLRISCGDLVPSYLFFTLRPRISQDLFSPENVLHIGCARAVHPQDQSGNRLLQKYPP